MSEKHPEIRRVLMSGDTVGGVWTYALQLSQALQPHGVEVILAATGGEATEEQNAAAAAIPNLKSFTSSRKLEWMEHPWPDVEASGAWLIELEKQFSPDVIHLNNYGFGTLRFDAPVILTTHSCVLSWWAAVKREPRPDTWNRYRFEVERSLGAADLVVAPSRAMLKAIQDNYAVKLPECRVIPNGVVQREEAGVGFSTARKEPIVLTAGRLWDEAKNAEALAEVALRLPWPVYLAGETRNPDGQEVHWPACRMLGQLSHCALARWYARAAIYAMPARYEPFGLSILEAALAGCALVLGDIPGLREIWGDSARFVHPDNNAELELILRDLMTDSSQREAMARRSYARALKLTARAMAQKYMDVYEQLAAKRRSMACVS